MPDVVVVATVDTKGREAQYILEQLAIAGASARVIDIGVLGTTSEVDVPIAVPAAEVAELGGEDLESLRTGSEQGGARGHALEVMTKGLAAALRRELDAGRLGCVLGIGGSSGSSVIGGALQALPVGVPKLLVSTMASGDVSPYVGIRDVTLMYSVTDIAGLNRISRVVLRNAARAAAGMAAPDGAAGGMQAEELPLVGISMFGVTTPAVMAVQAGLERAGFETNVFHATGAGGRAMEGLVADGLIDAVVDLTTSELTDELVGGVLSAGPDRMEAAGRRGIPQVLVPGALEIVNFGAEPTVPADFRTPERRLHVHNSAVTIVRTNVDESRELGRIFTAKANLAVGPTTVVLPLKGLSALDAPGEPYEDRAADDALFAEIRAGLRPEVKLVEVDAAINEPTFTDAVLAEFAAAWERR
jgi:uncharacterized protein (UPF0261 family)